MGVIMEQETNDLAHYGVKGMKWGKRKVEQFKARSSEKRSKKDAMDLAYNEGQNLKLGMDPKTAREQAQKKLERDAKVRKVLAVTAAVGLTAVAAYMVHKKIDRDFKSVNLSLDTPLKNINPEGAGRNVDRHLYVTYKKSDTNKYRGLLAKQYQRNAKIANMDNPIAALQAKQAGIDLSKFTDKVYETTLGLKTEVKAPSNNQAKKIYKQFQKNNPKLAKMSYREFNKNLVSADSKQARDAFFKEVSKRGYNAIIDTNDQWDSGYNTRRPIILMNAGKVAAEKHTRQLAQKEINKHARVETGKILTMTAGGLAAKASVITAVAKKGQNNDRRQIQESYIKRYRERNPKTNLSDAEIISKMP